MTALSPASHLVQEGENWKKEGKRMPLIRKAKIY
jgi:hypothetical protein